MKHIPPFRLVLEPLNDEARNLPGFEWAGDEVGTRHRIGGVPDIPEEDWPDCPDCGERMTFYGQLDSISDDYDMDRRRITTRSTTLCC